MSTSFNFSLMAKKISGGHGCDGEMSCLVELMVKGISFHGSLTRYVKLWVAHAPGMPGTFSPTTDFKGNR